MGPSCCCEGRHLVWDHVGIELELSDQIYLGLHIAVSSQALVILVPLVLDLAIDFVEMRILNFIHAHLLGRCLLYLQNVTFWKSFYSTFLDILLCLLVLRGHFEADADIFSIVLKLDRARCVHWLPLVFKTTTLIQLLPLPIISITFISNLQVRILIRPITVALLLDLDRLCKLRVVLGAFLELLGQSLKLAFVLFFLLILSGTF